MHLHRLSSLGTGGMPRCSNGQWAAIRQSPQKLRHLPATVSANKEGRTWGSGWGRKKGQATVRQEQRQELQEQRAPEQEARQLSAEDYEAAYGNIANSIHQSFLQNDIFACCQPASLLFYEAVKKVNPAADPNFVLGYVVVPEPSPGGPAVCGRHMWIQLDGKIYDIGKSVAIAMLQKRYGKKVPLPKYGLEKPPDAVYVGWDMARFSQGLKPNVTTERQDVALVEQFQGESGRELYWSGSPPQLLGVRTKILSAKWLRL